MINKGRGQTSNLIINIRGRREGGRECGRDGGRGSVLAVKHGEEGWRRRGGRVPTTHNALIYREGGEAVVHGERKEGRPTGYAGGRTAYTFSTLGRG